MSNISSEGPSVEIRLSSARRASWTSVPERVIAPMLPLTSTSATTVADAPRCPPALRHTGRLMAIASAASASARSSKSSHCFS